MSTHYIEEAERLADEVAVMHQGKIISRGRPAELIAEHAGTPHRRGLRAAAAADRAARRRRGGRPAGARRPARRSRSSAPSGPRDGVVPEDAVVRAATLEDVFVLLTGEEAE